MKGPLKLSSEVPARFPSTHWSVLSVAANSSASEESRRESLESLADLYWKPIYTYVRIRWGQDRERALDLTQDFFLWIVEGGFLDRIEQGRGRFRNFVRTCIDNFVRNWIRAEHRARRGGGHRIFSLDAGEDPDEFCVAATEIGPEEVLDRCWRLSLTDHAVARLREALQSEGRAKVFEVFSRYDLAGNDGDRPTYDALAAELGLDARDVDNYLSIARKRLYRILRDLVASSVDGPQSMREELRGLFGGPPPG